MSLLHPSNYDTPGGVVRQRNLRNRVIMIQLYHYLYEWDRHVEYVDYAFIDAVYNNIDFHPTFIRLFGDIPLDEIIEKFRVQIWYFGILYMGR